MSYSLLNFIAKRELSLPRFSLIPPVNLISMQTMNDQSKDKNHKATDFYDKNYKIVGQWMLEPEKKQFLGEAHSRKCRFCDRSEPETTFETLAHAIPESIGNKSLFSYYECDECNGKFGRGIESDFGNWSKPIRAMTRIKGKNGVPTVAKNGKLGWRVETDEQGDLRMKMKEAAPIFTVDEEKKQITFHLTRGDYTPAAVLKTFMKIALTLLPQLQMFYFSGLRNWVNEPDHKKVKLNFLRCIHSSLARSQMIN